MTVLWNSLRRISSTAGVAELRRGQAIFVALVLCGLVMLYLLGLLTRAGAPSGSDPGNWLAFSHELFGERVKAAAATYPPVAPALVKWLSLFFPPLVSVSILGAATSVLIGIPFFLLVHQRAGILWALLFTPGVLFLGYSMEMLAWGGYPQLLSQALLLFTLYWLGKGLLENRRLFLVLGAASASLSVGTSTFGVVFLGVAVPLSLLFLVTQERLHVRKVALQVGVWGALVVGMSLVFLPFYLNTIELQEGRAWNPHGYSLATSPAAFAYVFQEWPDPVGRLLLLLPLVVGLTLYCGWPRGRASSLAAASASLMLSSVLLFFTFFEVRALSLLEIGVLGALAFLLSDLFRRFERAHSHPVMVTAGRVGVGAVAVLLATVVIVLGQQRLVRALDWYRVLDGDVVAGLDWLRENALPESVVVASSTPRGHNYGWWIEGYSGIPTYNAIDPQWVIFREEKRQSRVAHQLLESGSGAETAELAQQHGIRYVFLDKRVGVGSSELVKGGFIPAFDNPTVVILRSALLLTGPPPPWWPGEGVTSDSALGALPSEPSGGESQEEASYYRRWYLLAKTSLNSVLGYPEGYQGENLLRKGAAASPLELWREVQTLKRASQSGVVGDPRYPEYHFRLWQALGEPPLWPPRTLLCSDATSITAPQPPAGVSSEAFQHWYKCNRAKLAVVYYGSEDPDSEVHASWAQKFDDLALYEEVVLLREALADGVGGSPDRPFEAFQDWEKGRSK